MSFENQIQKWLNIDNQIKLLNEKIKMLREEKSIVHNNIIHYAKNHNLSKSNFKIGEDKLKIIDTKISEPITFKYLEKTLLEIIKNEHQVKIIIDYIKKNREITIVNEIKRY